MLNSATRLLALKIALAIVSLTMATLASTAKADEFEEDVEVAAPPFPVVHRILKSACGRCHQDGHHRGGVQLNTPMQVNRDAAIILQSIESGSMPYMDPNWYQTRDAKTVIRYLKAVLESSPQSDNFEI